MVYTHITLRLVTENDLPHFFEYQFDPEANYMAAFTAKDRTDQDAFMAHWNKVLRDETITIRTILYEGEIVGSILCHGWFGEPEISYWIGKAWWGKGIATAALNAFLCIITERPLYARVVKDNMASLRVLQKCGFLVAWIAQESA